MINTKFRKLLFGIALFAGTSTVFAQQSVNTAAGSCKMLAASTVCVDTTPCKVVNGITACLSNVPRPPGAASVGKTCWSFQTSYSCLDNASIDTCTPAPWWNANTCSQTAVKCANTVPETGACSSYSLTYSCLTSPKQTQDQLVCGSGAFNNSLLPTPNNPNGTFAKAAVASEIARQMQVYANCDPADPTGCLNTPIFAGVQESCTKGWFGLKNCCNALPGAQSNSQAMSIGMGVGASVVKYAGQKAVDVASPYVFDAMYSGSEFTIGLANSAVGMSNVALTSNSTGQFISGGTSFASNGVSAYGFTYGASASSAVAGGGFMGGNIIIGGTTSAGEFTTVLAGSAEATSGAAVAATDFLMFNPYTFAAAIALQYAIGELQKALACTQPEQLLGMHKGANLSVQTGSYCEKKIPIIGTCIQYRDTYCSFNSVLARTVNQQGKAMLGIPFNSCSGLTVQQIANLDFTKIDLSEFANTMVAQAQSNLPSNIAGNYQPVMQANPQGKAQTPLSGTAYPTGFVQ